jgi:hypothetical protein
MPFTAVMEDRSARGHLRAQLRRAPEGTAVPEPHAPNENRTSAVPSWRAIAVRLGWLFVPWAGMSISALDRLLRRRRHHLAVLAVILVAGAAIAVHHTPMVEMGMGGAMVVCLAVLPALAVAAVRATAALMPRACVLAFVSPPYVGGLEPPQPRARSSPVSTVVLRR